MGHATKSVSDNPNVCASCASMLDDVPDSTLIESAIPYEVEPAPVANPAEPAKPAAEAAGGKPLVLNPEKAGS
jgi:hypothetical protein